MTSTNDKREYSSPFLELIEVDFRQAILAGSGLTDSLFEDDYRW